MLWHHLYYGIVWIWLYLIYPLYEQNRIELNRIKQSLSFWPEFVVRHFLWWMPTGFASSRFLVLALMCPSHFCFSCSVQGGHVTSKKHAGGHLGAAVWEGVADNTVTQNRPVCGFQFSVWHLVSLSSRLNVSFLTYVSVQSTSTGSHVGKPWPHMYWDEACTETSSEAVMRWLVYFIQRMIWLASSVCERQGSCYGFFMIYKSFFLTVLCSLYLTVVLQDHKLYLHCSEQKVCFYSFWTKTGGWWKRWVLHTYWIFSL